MTDTPSNNGRQAGGRFGHGNHYGRGRTNGSRNNATLAMENLLAGSANKVAKKAIAAAEAGEPWAIQLVVRSIIPPAHSSPVKIALPEVRDAADVPGALRAIIAAASEGRLTPQEALDYAALYDRLKGAFETAQLYDQIERLKAEVADLKPNGCNWLDQRGGSGALRVQGRG
jgi:hypothetical protein